MYLGGKELYAHDYLQPSREWLDPKYMFPSLHPVLVCLLNNVISAQRENIDAAASNHCSSARFQPSPVAHLASTLPSLVASAMHLQTLTPAHTPLRAPSANISPTPNSHPPTPCTHYLSPVFARLSSYTFRWNVLRWRQQWKTTSDFSLTF